MFHLHDNIALHLNDMEMLGTNRLIPKGFESGKTLVYCMRVEFHSISS